MSPLCPAQQSTGLHDPVLCTVPFLSCSSWSTTVATCEVGRGHLRGGPFGEDIIGIPAIEYTRNQVRESQRHWYIQKDGLWLPIQLVISAGMSAFER
jgi:hypothetical protein